MYPYSKKYSLVIQRLKNSLHHTYTHRGLFSKWERDMCTNSLRTVPFKCHFFEIISNLQSNENHKMMDVITGARAAIPCYIQALWPMWVTETKRTRILGRDKASPTTPPVSTPSYRTVFYSNKTRALILQQKRFISSQSIHWQLIKYKITNSLSVYRRAREDSSFPSRLKHRSSRIRLTNTPFITGTNAHS